MHRTIKLSKAQSFFLFGPRGSGKSTLLSAEFKGESALWIDLFNQRLEFELSQNPDRLLDLCTVEKPKWIVIDEVQKIPRILDGDKFNLQKALKFGLLPKIWNETQLTNSDLVDFLYSYVQTYLKEEVAVEQLVRNLETFRRFLVAAAQSNGKIVNHAKLERDAGVAARQALRHFEILADTLIGFYLEPFNTSVRKRQTAHSKFYFFDCGVVRALQNTAPAPLAPASCAYGNLFETFSMNEFVKLRAGLNLRWNFSYLRTGSDQEIDLIIQKNKGRPILVEFKSADQIQPEDIGRLKRLSDDIEHSAVYILSNAAQEIESQGIRCIHWSRGLKEIFDVEA